MVIVFRALYLINQCTRYDYGNRGVVEQQSSLTLQQVGSQFVGPFCAVKEAEQGKGAVLDKLLYLAAVNNCIYSDAPDPGLDFVN